MERTYDMTFLNPNHFEVYMTGFFFYLFVQIFISCSRMKRRKQNSFSILFPAFETHNAAQDERLGIVDL